jgi:hypothetical protein
VFVRVPPTPIVLLSASERLSGWFLGDAAPKLPAVTQKVKPPRAGAGRSCSPLRALPSILFTICSIFKNDPTRKSGTSFSSPPFSRRALGESPTATHLSIHFRNWPASFRGNFWPGSRFTKVSELLDFHSFNHPRKSFSMTAE